MWIMLVWLLASDGTAAPQAALIMQSENECRAMSEVFNVKFADRNLKTECLRSTIKDSHASNG